MESLIIILFFGLLVCGLLFYRHKKGAVQKKSQQDRNSGSDSTSGGVSGSDPSDHDTDADSGDGGGDGGGD